MNMIAAVLLAVVASTSPLAGLHDDDVVVTNVETPSSEVFLDRQTRVLYEFGNTNRVSLDTIPVNTGMVMSAVSYGTNSRFTVAMNRSGSQTTAFPENGAFFWVPDDSSLRFGGARSPDGTVIGANTVGSRIRSSVQNATNGLISVSSDEWISLTNRINTFRTSDISMSVVNGDMLYNYSIRADGRIDKEAYWIHEVTRSATTQGVITVEYPKYIFRRGPVEGYSLGRGSWKGPFFKKVAGEIKWTYDSDKTSSDLIGYTTEGDVSSIVRNYYFNGSYPSSASRYSFAFDAAKSSYLCAVIPFDSTWWIGRSYRKNAYAPFGGSVDFASALKGTNTEEYVGYGDLYNPNVSSVYTESKWYLDRTVGSGEYFSYIVDIPYQYTEIVTNLVERYNLRTVESESELRFIVTQDGLKYVVKSLTGLQSPWHLDMSYYTRVVSVDLPYRGLNSSGSYVWSAHGDSSKWTCNPTSEWATVVYDPYTETWGFTGGLESWYVPDNGDVNGVYWLSWHGFVKRPDEYVNYPCHELAFTGTVVTAGCFPSSVSGTPEFKGTYTRSVPIKPSCTTNSISSADIDTLKGIFVQRSVVTNGTTYSASPRLLNGKLIMVYE